MWVSSYSTGAMLPNKKTFFNLEWLKMKKYEWISVAENDRSPAYCKLLRVSR